MDADSGLARFVLTCNSINGDVLCLNRAAARISVGEHSGLRVPAAAVHYLKEDGTCLLYTSMVVPTARAPGSREISSPPSMR